MFGLGLIEIAVIAVVALVFIRPKDIPRLLSKIGRLYGQATRQVNEMRRLVADFEHEVRHSDGNKTGRDDDEASTTGEMR